MFPRHLHTASTEGSDTDSGASGSGLPQAVALGHIMRYNNHCEETWCEKAILRIEGVGELGRFSHPYGPRSTPRRNEWNGPNSMTR